MIPRILRWAYQLRYHRLGDWGLDRWAVTLALGTTILILLPWAFRGMLAMPISRWLILAVLALLAGALLWLRWWAARRSYVVFLPEPEAAPPAGQPLDPTDKILIRATGRFEVEGKSHFFAELLAYWRTFATREHAVMAIVHRSRFLWLGSWPEEDLGMWYIFFRPEAIEAITPGRLIFGTVHRLGLQVRYRSTSTHSAGQKRRTYSKTTTESVYLSFDDEDSRQRIWADLLADG